MEIELKYRLRDGDAALILKDPDVISTSCGKTKIIHMHSIYYDTTEQALAHENLSLRLRYEGSVPEADCKQTDYVCCMKRKIRKERGFSRREEYECTASDIYQGIDNLIAAGAPADVLMPCKDLQLVNVAEVLFVRRCLHLNVSGSILELALDEGTFPTPDGGALPLCELELELKSGDEAHLLSFGQYLAETYRLEPEPSSKFARARIARSEQ